MLLELAIGDAYGAGFEYAPTWTIIKFNNLQGYVQHPKHKNLKTGSYTDDTQMSMAIAELIVSGEEWTPLALAECFVNCFKRDPREGYAGGFYRFLTEVKNGKEFLEKIRPYSDKSGATMRAGPIGIYSSVEEVIEKATMQAKVTHDSPGGITSAAAAALMTHFFIHKKGKIKDLGEYVSSYVEGNWIKSWKGKVGSKGWMSVNAAMTAVQRNSKLCTLLQDCVNFSGDVDTVATIALGAASCSTEYEPDLPKCLYENLENGKYGREYLRKLNQLLMGLKK